MSNDLFLKITEIIDKSFHVEQHGKILLKDNKSSKGKPTELSKSGKSLCVQWDKEKKDLLPFFSNSQHKNGSQSVEGLLTMSDNTIFYIKKDTLFVFTIELKSVIKAGAFKQVLAGYEFNKYICQTARRLINYKDFDIQFRGLIFSEKASAKIGTNPQDIYQKHDKTGLLYTHLQSGHSYNLDFLCVP